MGWWDQNIKGESFRSDSNDLVWGDRPADIIDSAIVEIERAFISEFGRPPSQKELLAGFQFSLRGYEPGDAL